MSAEECSRRCLPQKTGKRRSPFGYAVCLFVLLTLMSIDKVHCRPNEVAANGHQNLGDNEGYLADGENATNDDDEDDGANGGGEKQQLPVILTTGLNVEAAEGTTVRLPCKLQQETEYALLWTNGTKTICTEGNCFTNEPSRVKVNQPDNEFGYTLTIEYVTANDAGQYTCKLSVPEVKNEVSITHTLRVTQPAHIVDIEPKVAAKLEKMKGDPLYLQCKATGYPAPTITWTKSSKKILVATNENDNSSVVVANGPEVRIESLTPSDAGFYECKTENIYHTDRKGFPLEVNYAPEIQVPKTVVNTGETYTATLTCIVRSFPKPRVSWMKGDQLLEIVGTKANAKYDDPRESGTNTYKLIIKHINAAEDFATYKCRAENKHGLVIGDPIIVTGSPAKPAMIETKTVDTNEVSSNAGRSTQVVWVVDSWSPVLEYQVEYKRQQDDEWKAFEHQPQVREPESPSKDELKYRIDYTFTMTDSATFVARARARNDKGWSEWSDDVIFSGGTEDANANEIPDQNADKVIKASTGKGTASSTSYSAVNVCLTMAFALFVARHLGITDNSC